MEVTTISTSVPDTAAAIVSVAPNSTHVPQKVTIVWSTLRHSCGHTIAHQPAGQVPELFDQTGLGAWAANTGVHCPQCGSRFSVPARVVTRALERAEIDEVASEVAAWAADNQWTSARDTAAEVLGPDGETLVTVDLADPPEWLDLAALRADAAAHGDTDLVATIDDLL